MNIVVNILHVHHQFCLKCLKERPVTINNNNSHLSATVQDNQASRYQNDTILDFTAAKDDGDGSDNSSYKIWKGTIISLPPTYPHPTFYRPDALPDTQPTVSQH